MKKKVVVVGSAVLIALLLTIGGFAFALPSGSVAFAQEGTAVAGDTTVQAAQPVDDDDNDFPWGLLGLAGLAGLAGLRRRPEPTRVETTGNVRTYDSK